MTERHSSNGTENVNRGEILKYSIHGRCSNVYRLCMWYKAVTEVSPVPHHAECHVELTVENPYQLVSFLIFNFLIFISMQVMIVNILLVPNQNCVS